MKGHGCKDELRFARKDDPNLYDGIDWSQQQSLNYSFIGLLEVWLSVLQVSISSFMAEDSSGSRRLRRLLPYEASADSSSSSHNPSLTDRKRPHIKAACEACRRRRSKVHDNKLVLSILFRDL